MKKLMLSIVLLISSISYAHRDLETGTFLTRDPIGYDDGPNIYCYVSCNPITRFDPLGLALYAQDGTWSHEFRFGTEGLGNGGQANSLFKLKENWNKPAAGDAHYFRGVGNEKDYSWLGQKTGGVFGLGSKKIAETTYKQIVENYNNGDTEINLAGWSRGAAQTMETCWMVYEKGIPDLKSAYTEKRRVRKPNGKGFKTVKTTKYKNYLVEPKSKEKVINQVHLIDPVFSMGAPDPWINIGWHDGPLPPNIKNAYVYKADYDPNIGFQQTIPQNATTTSYSLQGSDTAHRDVAGGTQSQAGADVYNLMTSRLNSDTVRVKQ